MIGMYIKEDMEEKLEILKDWVEREEEVNKAMMGDTSMLGQERRREAWHGGMRQEKEEESLRTGR